MRFSDNVAASRVAAVGILFPQSFREDIEFNGVRLNPNGLRTVGGPEVTAIELLHELRESIGHMRSWHAMYMALQSDGRRAYPELFAADSPFRPFLDQVSTALLHATFVGFGKVFDTNPMVASFRALALTSSAENHPSAAKIAQLCAGFGVAHATQISAVLGIRHNRIAHITRGASRAEIYAANSITPNQETALINAAAELLDEISGLLGESNVVVHAPRFERSVTAALAALADGLP